MRFTFSITAAAAMATGLAMADNNASFQASAKLGEVCEIVELQSDIDLSNVAPNTWAPDAVFRYRCNFNGNPILKFTSAKGGIEHNTQPGLKADYGIFLNDANITQSPSGSLRASNATSGAAFDYISNAAPAGSIRSPYFRIGLIDPLTLAGTYSDTLTISIAP